MFHDQRARIIEQDFFRHSAKLHERAFQAVESALLPFVAECSDMVAARVAQLGDEQLGTNLAAANLNQSFAKIDLQLFAGWCLEPHCRARFCRKLLAIARDGPFDPVTGVERFVRSPARRNGALTAGRWITTDAGLKFTEIDEDVGLAPKVIGKHRGPGRNSRDHRDTDAAALHRSYKRAKVTVARKQNHLIDVRRQLHCINNQFDVHAGLHFATTTCVNKLLRRLGQNRIAVVGKPIDQWADGEILLILAHCGVVERAHHYAPISEVDEQPPVVDVESKRLCGRVEIGAIDKERDPVGR